MAERVCPVALPRLQGKCSDSLKQELRLCRWPRKRFDFTPTGRCPVFGFETGGGLKGPTATTETRKPAVPATFCKGSMALAPAHMGFQPSASIGQGPAIACFLPAKASQQTSWTSKGQIQRETQKQRKDRQAVSIYINLLCVSWLDDTQPTTSKHSHTRPKDDLPCSEGIRTFAAGTTFLQVIGTCQTLGTLGIPRQL